MIKEKVEDFYKQKYKVHITKFPNAKFPKGKFHNGEIKEIYENKFDFEDDKEGIIDIFFREVMEIDKFRTEVFA